MAFRLVTDLAPMGDQPRAIEELVSGLKAGQARQLLLGATGTGKTFTMANVIARVNRPALVLAHNKTLAAQLYAEFRELFPDNAVEYFVSYYDYYQPEAYVPNTDTYIEKDSLINDEIDRMRHSATRSLLTRNDVIVVASVSCIYGIGASEVYEGMTLDLAPGTEVERDDVLRHLVELQYERNDIDFARGTFRVRGDTVEVFPVYEEERALRLEWFGDELEAIKEVDPLRGRVHRELEKIRMFPASHYVTTAERRAKAVHSIEEELRERLQRLTSENKLLEAQRLEQRTTYDLEMLQTIGTVKGIENYSRHLSGRRPGEPPPTLLDYFPDDFVMFIDESHQTVPQVGGDVSGRPGAEGHAGGLRLPAPVRARQPPSEVRRVHPIHAAGPSSCPRRPQSTSSTRRTASSSSRSSGPPGCSTPVVEVRPAGHQVDELLEEIRVRVERKERVLVTTLTKRMAEDLTEYYQDLGVRVRYLHSDIDALERADVIRDLRYGKFDVLVGINLLREGLDIPEVSLVAILDADKEGFLRGERSLIQTIGRAARNASGHVIMFADTVTASMRAALDETERRRAKQRAFNEEHGITPRTIEKRIGDLRSLAGFRTELAVHDDESTVKIGDEVIAKDEIPKLVVELKKKMMTAARDLDFEQAAAHRDRIHALEAAELGVSEVALPAEKARRKGRSGTPESPPVTSRSAARADWRERTRDLPRSPGVYVMRGIDDEVIYVGKAKNLRSRVASYFQEGTSDYRAFVGLLGSLLREIETIVTSSEKEALLLERELIRKHEPRFNVIWRDDKQYLMLRIDTDHEWPWVQVVRNAKDDGARYFGPFHSASAARQTLRAVNRHFRLRTCRDSVLYRRKRPCIEYQIGAVSGPVLHRGRSRRVRAERRRCVDVPRGPQGRARVPPRVANVVGLGADGLRDRRPLSGPAPGRGEDAGAAARRAGEPGGPGRPGHLSGGRGPLHRGRRGPGGEGDERQPPPLRAGDRIRRGGPRVVHPPEVGRGRGPGPSTVLLPVELSSRAALEEIASERRGRRVRILRPQRGEKARLSELAASNAEHGLREQRLKSGATERTLEALRRGLRLDRMPLRIECYDISNFGPHAIVASRVVFERALPAKARYRRYRIRTTDGQNDFASMYEVLSRRFRSGLTDGDRPDLVVIDGGKGQLGAARAALDDLGVSGVDLVSLAKSRITAPGDRPERSPERVFRPGESAPIVLDPHSPELLLLARIRDEAHRFAITFHRELQRKAKTRSGLEDVPGIGPRRRKALLEHFGSLRRLREASLEELAGVPGVGRVAARALHRALHPGDSTGGDEHENGAAPVGKLPVESVDSMNRDA